MTRHLRFPTWTSLALALMTTSALATPPVASQTKARTEVRIVSDSVAIEPGETFRIGLLFRPDPGWHVYWLNPGDTGLPTRVTFEASKGLSFGTIAWPAPTRFVDKLGGLSYGYEGEVLLQSEVRAPDDLFAEIGEGATVRVEAKTSWLACKENCIQGSVTVGLDLPIRALPADERQSADAPLFGRFLALTPTEPEAGWTLRFAQVPAPVKGGEDFTLSLRVEGPDGQAVTPFSDPSATFVPLTDKGLIIREVKAAPDGPALNVTLSGEAMFEPSPLTERLDGVLRVMHGDTLKVFELGTVLPREAGDPPQPAETSIAPAPGAASGANAAELCEGVTGSGADEALDSFLLALLFAFLGGLILNAMPCVLPVLSIKVLSLVEQSQQSRQVIWRHGLAYTAGVLLSFLALALLLIALQATNWAFQMQDPTFIAIFTAIVFAFALSLFGVFEIAMPGASRMDQAVANSHGYTSSFNYGIFAVLLGTPCTAPFLGPAMTYAFTQPPIALTALLLMVGLGLAFPFLMLALFPAWRRFMPRPGAWLLTFKKAMGFLLVGTAVFLLHTLAHQVSRDAFVGYLIFLSFLSFALWIYGNWTDPGRSTRTRVIASTVALATVALSASAFVSDEPPPAPAGSVMAGGISWLDFDQIDVNRLAEDGRTVFIDFTAEWCTTCKVNENGVLYTDRVREALEALDVTAVKGDFTVHKPEIAAWLQRFNQPSVPLYVVIPAGRPADAFALPTLLTIDDVVAGLCRGGASTHPTTAAR